MGTHTGSTSPGFKVIALWGHTLDQHHLGLRLYLMGTHTGSTSPGFKVIALWGHTLDQHHLGLRL